MKAMAIGVVVEVLEEVAAAGGVKVKRVELYKNVAVRRLPSSLLAVSRALRFRAQYKLGTRRAASVM
jgi:hypothetical protein